MHVQSDVHVVVVFKVFFSFNVNEIFLLDVLGEVYNEKKLNLF